MPVLMCPHCGSSITADDVETTQVRCPVCGAALGLANTSIGPSVREAVVRDAEDDSATRAVAREKFAQHLTPLDADYQSVPSVSAAPRPFDDGVTQVSAPHNVEHNVEHNVLPGAPVIATQLHEPTQELPRSAIPEPPRATGGGMRRLSIALAGLIIVAAIVIAALATNGLLFGQHTPPQGQTTGIPTTAPTATPTVGPTFQISGLYRVSYPIGWLVQQKNNSPQTYSTLFAAPAGTVGSINIIAQKNINVAAPDQLDDQFIRALAQPGATYTPTPPATISIGGQTWTDRTANIALASASGQPTLYSHVEALSVVHGDYVYTIVEIAPASSAAVADAAFSSAAQTYFDPMLKTFTFQG